MVIRIGTELESAIAESARRSGSTVQELVLTILNQRFLNQSRLAPRDEWERRLLASASDCGVSLPNLALTSEAIYD